MSISATSVSSTIHLTNVQANQLGQHVSPAGETQFESQLKLDEASARPHEEPLRDSSISNDLEGSNKKKQDDCTLVQASSLRVAVVGNVDSGKSTLVGVLTTAKADDGRGSARNNVFLHPHERETGRTTTVAHHLYGYKATGEHVACGDVSSSLNKTKSWQHIDRHAARKVTLFDLPGHEKYLKTTVAGVCALNPDVVLIIVNGLSGVTKMTREHLGLAIVLNLPVVVVVTKIDKANVLCLKETKRQIHEVITSASVGRQDTTVKTVADVDALVAHSQHSAVPVFYASSVTGQSLTLLHRYLATVQPRTYEVDAHTDVDMPLVTCPPLTTPLVDFEMRVEDVFSKKGVGVIVSGTITKGTVNINDRLMLGPTFSNEFIPVVVKGIHINRSTVNTVSVGTSCSFALKVDKTFKVKSVGVNNDKKAHKAQTTTGAQDRDKDKGADRKGWFSSKNRNMNKNKQQGGLIMSKIAELARTHIRRGMVLVRHTPAVLDTLMKGSQLCNTASAKTKGNKTNTVPIDGLSTVCGVGAFEVEMHILHHATTIQVGYQAVVHCNAVTQSATLVGIVRKYEPTSTLAVPVATDTDTDTTTTTDVNLPTGFQFKLDTTTEPEPEDCSEQVLRSGDHVVLRLEFMYNNEWLNIGDHVILRDGSVKGVGRVVKLL